MKMALGKDRAPQGSLAGVFGDGGTQWARAFWRDEGGQDLVEYGLIAGLIGLACIASMRGLTNGVVALFSKVGSTLGSAT